MLASSPECFDNELSRSVSQTIQPWGRRPVNLTNSGLSITLPILSKGVVHQHSDLGQFRSITVGLYCSSGVNIESTALEVITLRLETSVPKGYLGPDNALNYQRSTFPDKWYKFVTDSHLFNTRTKLETIMVDAHDWAHEDAIH